MYSGEATHTSIIVLGLTRSGLEPTIYRTRCEDANHNTTDAVEVAKYVKTPNTNNDVLVFLCCRVMCLYVLISVL
jgi:hypothetical protein